MIVDDQMNGPTPDDRLIVELLCGRDEHDEYGLPHTIYPKNEQDGRRALARKLRSSKTLDLGLRFVLADLFDPDQGEIDRQVWFGYRRKGRPVSSFDELETRLALVRLLRTSRTLHPNVLCFLADAFDPDGAVDGQYLRFNRRRPGHPAVSPAGEQMIAEFILSQVESGAGMKSAIWHAQQRFGRGPSSLRAIWRTWKKILERLQRRVPLTLSSWN